MSYGTEYLEQIRGQLNSGSNCWRKGVNVLGAFGYTRRRQTAVDLINSELKRIGLVTDPVIDTGMPLDTSIRFYLADEVVEVDDELLLPPPVPPEPEPQGEIEDTGHLDDLAAKGTSPTDHTFRVANLEAAEREPLCVAPDDPIERAITLMEMKNFSQLPVVTGPRDIKGLVSYRSITRARLSGQPNYVRECLEPAVVVGLDTPLLEVIGKFRTDDAVLVLGTDRRLSGIVTPSDIANEYGTMTGPFLQIGEIENLLRWLIKPLDLRKALDLPDAPDVDDLTLGDIQRVLTDSACWAQLGLKYDQKAFCEGLNRVRETRNAVMHFRGQLQIEQAADLEGFSRLVKQVCFGRTN